jgi:type I restriction enzyme S subunit
MLAPEYPASWQSVRLRFVCDFNPSKRQIAGLDPSVTVSFVPMEKVSEDGALQLDDDRPIYAVSNGFTFFAEGDVVVAKITPCFENGKGAECRGLTNGIGFGTTEFHVLRSKHLDSRFLFYLTASDPFRTIGATEMSGAAGQKRVPESFLQNLIVPVPPLPLQRRIAAYLDRETARIDALVAEKEELLRLLEEKRASLISHAVTRGLSGVASAKTGLDPNAKLKPSGIPWLGEVPEHWELKELRHIAAKGTKITYGIVQAGPDIPDGIPYIRTSDMSGDFLAEDGYQKTSAEIDQSYARSRVYEGDMVISIRASVGKTLSVPKYLNGANLTQGTAKVSPGERIVSRFLFHWMNSHPVQRYLGSISKGTTFKEITLDMLRRTPILVPPDEEQKRIALSCDRSLEVFRSLNKGIKTSIALLREKRSSLISAAVTGGDGGYLTSMPQ